MLVEYFSNECFKFLCARVFWVAASSVTNSEIIDLQYLPEFESVCIITATGEFLLIAVDSNSSGDAEVELVGMVECGVASACWSPDQELCAIITNEYNLLMMTTDWDVIFEVPLDDEVGVIDIFNRIYYVH